SVSVGAAATGQLVDGHGRVTDVVGHTQLGNDAEGLRHHVAREVANEPNRQLLGDHARRGRSFVQTVSTWRATMSSGIPAIDVKEKTCSTGVPAVCSRMRAAASS